MAKHITAAVAQTGASSSEARIRQHTVSIDRPPASGGGDQGPMGGELFLAAVGGCFMSNLLAAAAARGAAVSQARVDVTGSLVEAPMRYDAVHMRVSATCDDPALLAKLVEIADRGCIMTNTIRDILTLEVQPAI